MAPESTIHMPRNTQQSGIGLPDTIEEASGGILLLNGGSGAVCPAVAQFFKHELADLYSGLWQ